MKTLKTTITSCVGWTVGILLFIPAVLACVTLSLIFGTWKNPK